MDQETLRHAVDNVRLQLGDIVGDVIDYFKTEMEVVLVEDLGEALPDPMGDELAVGEGRIGGAVHGAEVVFAFGCVEGGAGQFAVGGPQTTPTHYTIEDLEVIGRNLV